MDGLPARDAWRQPYAQDRDHLFESQYEGVGFGSITQCEYEVDKVAPFTPPAEHDIQPNWGGQFVAIPESLHEECLLEAKRTFPLESGGAFMGVRAADGSFLIRYWISPGPNADHGRYDFQPDQDWQWAEMERLYNLHHGQLEFLGDWHSHPRARVGQLSRTDRRAVREILSSETNHTRQVISAIIYGGEPEYNVCFWVAELRPRKLLWPKFNIYLGELNLLK